MTGINGNLRIDDSVIFVDSFSIKELQKPLYENKKIISFDDGAHRILSEKKIEHIISDKFLPPNLPDLIQKTAYQFSLWGNSLKNKNFVEYDGINLGSLFYDEFLYETIKILKNFFEIKNIIQSFPEIKIFAAGDLYDLSSLFSKNIEKIHIPDDHLFGTERIRLNFKLGNRSHVYFINRKTYLKIKNIFEKFVGKFVSHKNSTNKNILLVEFNTKRYQDIFLAASTLPLNLLYYGRRRPAFWDWKSFSIIKNSNTSIVFLDSILNNEEKIKIKKLIENFHNTFDKWINTTEEFENLFKIDEISLDGIFKKYIQRLFSRRIVETITEIEISKKFFKTHKIDQVLILSEIGFIEQIILQTAKDHDVKISLLQEGFHWDTKEANSMNHSQGIYPILSDEFIIWNKLDEKDAIENANIQKNKIKLLGSPRHDHFFKSLKSKNQDYVLLATIGPQPENIHGLLSKNIEKYEKSVRSIAQICKKLNKHLVIKLHPSPDELDVSDIIKEINSDFEIITAGDIENLIPDSSLVIVLDLSTVIVEAQMLEKPVICFPVIDYNWGSPTIFRSKSCIITDIDSLEYEMKKIFSDNNYYKEQIHIQKNFLDENFVNMGCASKEILNYLLK